MKKTFHLSAARDYALGIFIVTVTDFALANPVDPVIGSHVHEPWNLMKGRYGNYSGCPRVGSTILSPWERIAANYSTSSEIFVGAAAILTGIYLQSDPGGSCVTCC